MNNIGKIRIGSHLFAKPTDLLILEAKENYTLIEFVSGKKLLVATTLGKLQERLALFGFFRSSRSVLVNMKYVKNVDTSGRYFKIILKNNENLHVSRRRGATLLKISNHFERTYS
jgi:DNA-binding LytR/AlgR family response regulator